MRYNLGARHNKKVQSSVLVSRVPSRLHTERYLHTQLMNQCICVLYYTSVFPYCRGVQKESRVHVIGVVYGLFIRRRRFFYALRKRGVGLFFSPALSVY